KQSPFGCVAPASSMSGRFFLLTQSGRQAIQVTGIEFISVVDPRAQGQENRTLLRAGNEASAGGIPMTENCRIARLT
ncbi:MAG: hypothetical protein WCA41_09555, partial [Candidatus Acidiferrum sp.]